MEPHPCEVCQPDMIRVVECMGWVRPRELAAGGQQVFILGEHLRGHPCLAICCFLPVGPLVDHCEVDHVGNDGVYDCAHMCCATDLVAASMFLQSLEKTELRDTMVASCNGICGCHLVLSCALRCHVDCDIVDWLDDFAHMCCAADLVTVSMSWQSLETPNNFGCTDDELPLFSLVSDFAGMDVPGLALSELNVLGAHVAFDIDDAARQFLTRNFPQVSLYGSVCERLPGSTRGTGIVTAGFPCQPYSLIGLQQGWDNDKGRGHLVGASVGLVLHE